MDRRGAVRRLALRQVFAPAARPGLVEAGLWQPRCCWLCFAEERFGGLARTRLHGLCTSTAPSHSLRMILRSHQTGRFLSIVAYSDQANKYVIWTHGAKSRVLVTSVTQITVLACVKKQSSEDVRVACKLDLLPNQRHEAER
jgi:hypothetical protein